MCFYISFLAKICITNTTVTVLPSMKVFLSLNPRTSSVQVLTLHFLLSCSVQVLACDGLQSIWKIEKCNMFCKEIYFIRDQFLCVFLDVSPGKTGFQMTYNKWPACTITWCFLKCVSWQNWFSHILQVKFFK